MIDHISQAVERVTQRSDKAQKALQGPFNSLLRVLGLPVVTAQAYTWECCNLAYSNWCGYRTGLSYVWYCDLGNTTYACGEDYTHGCSQGWRTGY